MPSLAVVGAGAVGGTLAAYLTLSGADVTLIARGESFRRIRERG
ncbi:MAG: 2-dehydropantoate 2-reductase, partial [Thermoplasmata archaeon]